ncbi:MAG: dihydropteroate synthase [SAR202 cluster bacterium]|nr:dihydropteroate synthase [SAR202 cluster bacterium]MDP6798873.1 dihydropteroate synthase [SAR202 cluster bacterium]
MRPERRDIPATTIGKTAFEWGAKTFVMGVVNVTPDSFSGDGIGSDVDAAVDLAVRMQAHGADIVDVGGESTRPPGLYADAAPITVEEELARVLPVIRALAQAVDIPISVDTYKARVAEMALEAGASFINDIWGFRRDPDMARVAADSGVPVVLMHNQDHTRYRDVVPDVVDELRRITESAVAAGVERENIIIDPGMGFGKTAQHNLEILRRLDEFRTLGQPILIGMSRKSTIGYVLELPVGDRVEGDAATVALSIANGADIVRVHDVKQMARVAKMSDVIVRGWAGER